MCSLNILPAQAASLETTYRDYLTKKGVAENDPGAAVGQKAAAQASSLLRANDGRAPNPSPAPFNGDTKAGMWRPTTSYQSGGATPAPGNGSAMAGRRA